MDIEGAEYGVASRLLHLDVLCQLDLVLIEFHSGAYGTPFYKLWHSMGKVHTDMEPLLANASGVASLAAARGCSNVTVLPLIDAAHG